MTGETSYTDASRSAAAADVVAEARAAIDRLSRAREAIGQVIYGQERVVELSLATLLAGGHGLLVGAPGLAKTKLVITLGRVLGLDPRRVQFTPDLMPADILGSEVLDQAPGGARSFRFIPGPIFCQLLMADEINRASPRTQSALLEAMQERQISVAGHAHKLPAPFHVLATQNPIEQEGTYPLPEAQLDRFLLQIDVDFPLRDVERDVLIRTTGAEETAPEPVMTAEELMAMQRLVRRMPVGEQLVERVLDITRKARPGEAGAPALVDRYVEWGPGPRAGQALMLAARALALLHARTAPSSDDVDALAEAALVHRIGLKPGARADGVDERAIVRAVLEANGR